MPGILATGYRKTSIARIMLKPGTGSIRVNGKAFKDYFPSQLLQLRSTEPFETVKRSKQFDVTARILGGGISSQTDALRHAIAKALSEFDPNFKQSLRDKGFLTRDARVKERVKAGLRGARKARQYRKR
ncbi:MAG TPA: 30S ribosomal protein S9 [Caldisericia bacterium]|nr:30S ribosomal protein S9 [Caldisericia bacterium]